MEYTRTTTSLNAAILMILFFHSTTGTFVIFRKVGVLPGSTIFVDLSVAYDFGLLGFHRLRWTGFCKQNDVFHCVLQVQNIESSAIHFYVGIGRHKLVPEMVCDRTWNTERTIPTVVPMLDDG